MRMFNKPQCSIARTSGTKKKAKFIRPTGHHINFSKTLYGYVSTSELNMTRILNIYSGTEAMWQEHLESLISDLLTLQRRVAIALLGIRSVSGP